LKSCALRLQAAEGLGGADPIASFDDDRVVVFNVEVVVVGFEVIMVTVEADVVMVVAGLVVASDFEVVVVVGFEVVVGMIILVANESSDSLSDLNFGVGGFPSSSTSNSGSESFVFIRTGIS
jgi:hypothetical protein